MEVQDQMKGLAFIQVRAAREAGGPLLDFSHGSLRELDRLIDRDVAKKPLDAEALSEVIGAYLGETIVRRLGAQWVEGAGGTPELSLGEMRLQPVHRARLRIERGRRRSLFGYFKAVQAAQQKGRIPEDLEDA